MFSILVITAGALQIYSIINEKPAPEVVKIDLGEFFRIYGMHKAKNPKDTGIVEVKILVDMVNKYIEEKGKNENLIIIDSQNIYFGGRDITTDLILYMQDNDVNIKWYLEDAKWPPIKKD